MAVFAYSRLKITKRRGNVIGRVSTFLDCYSEGFGKRYITEDEIQEL